MNNAVHWRVMNAGLPCNLTRGLMQFYAPLCLRLSLLADIVRLKNSHIIRTKSFTVSTFLRASAMLKAEAEPYAAPAAPPPPVFFQRRRRRQKCVGAPPPPPLSGPARRC